MSLCPFRDAAMLACSFKTAKDAYARCRWARTVRTRRDGAVLEPAKGVYDVRVAPGANVQAAVDGCRPGGSVLLLPGEHNGPLVLEASKEVHVFGRRRATLQLADGHVITSDAATSTIDGLTLGRVPGGTEAGRGVWVRGGRLRVQACDIVGPTLAGVFVNGGADPIVVATV